MCLHTHYIFFSLFSGEDVLIDFREGRSEGERERETSICCLLYVPGPMTEPIASVYALTGNRTHDLLVYAGMLQPADPYWPGLHTHYFI